MPRTRHIIGIIGGIAPPSTIDYYRLLVEGWQRRRPDGTQPLIVINSIELQKGLELVARASQGDTEPFIAYMVEEVERLARAGASFGFFAANTPHIVFDDIAARSPIPLVSIAAATAASVASQLHRRVGVLGTRFTMESGFYDRALQPHGIEVVVPDEPDRTWAHEHYLGELTKNVFRDETRAGFAAVIERMKSRTGMDALIFGGTELPLLMRDAPQLGVPTYDTTQIHVEAVLDRALDGAAH
jgi:aspartate racemase